MKSSVISNRLLKTFIGCAILFVVLAINQIVRDTIRHDREVKKMCADFGPVDGAGRPEICK